MEDIFTKIENIFEQKDSEDYCKEILKEIKELKQLLKFSPKDYRNEYKKYLPKEYFEFLNKLRDKMKPSRDFSPTLHFEGMELGMNEKGLLYNKLTNRILPSYKAFYIYEKLFFEKLIDI